MLRAPCLALALLTPSLFAQSSAPPDLGANAALKYWQAFATLPRLTDDERKLLGDCLTIPLDARARGIVDKSSYALRMMHHAAAQPRCDWGIAWNEEGIDVRLPHHEGARMLANLACLLSRLRFAEGKIADALDDLLAAMTLGRHVPQDGANLMLLVGFAIEHRTAEALALGLPRLDAATVKALRKRLDGLPPGSNVAASMRLEERFALNWFIRKVKEAKDKESLLALATLARDTPEKGRAFLEECGGTAEGVLRFAEQTRAAYHLMTKKLDLPPDQFRKVFEDEQKKQAGNPVFRLLFPAVEKMRLHQARMDVRRAMLSAALDVQLRGRDALKEHPDPVVGGPFEYMAFKGGFELRSKWQLDEKLRAEWKLDDRWAKPITLTVGRREE
jgi:hypothetical protein